MRRGVSALGPRIVAVLIHSDPQSTLSVRCLVQHGWTVMSWMCSGIDIPDTDRAWCGDEIPRGRGRRGGAHFSRGAAVPPLLEANHCGTEHLVISCNLWGLTMCPTLTDTGEDTTRCICVTAPKRTSCHIHAQTSALTSAAELPSAINMLPVSQRRP